MKSKVLLVILVSESGMRLGKCGHCRADRLQHAGMEKGFASQPNPGPPSSSVMASDGIIGRPLGLATTIAGTGVFLVTPP